MPGIYVLQAFADEALSWLAQPLTNDTDRWEECARIAFTKARNEKQVQEAYIAFIHKFPRTRQKRFVYLSLIFGRRQAKNKLLELIAKTHVFLHDSGRSCFSHASDTPCRMYSGPRSKSRQV